MTPSWKADVAAAAPVALNKIRQRNWLTALNCSILKARGKGFAFSGLGPFGCVMGPQMGLYQRPLPVLGTPVRRGTAPISDDFVTSSETVVNIPEDEAQTLESILTRPTGGANCSLDAAGAAASRARWPERTVTSIASLDISFPPAQYASPYCSRTLPRFLTYGFVQHLCGRPICTQAIFWLAWWESGRDAPVAEVLLLSGMIL